MTDTPRFGDGIAEFAAENRPRYRAALARVAQETPDQAAAALARADGEALAAADRLRAANRRARYLDSRPAEHEHATLADLLSQQDPAGRGRGWLASTAKNALIMGPSGHGKTRLAYAIGNTACDQGRWVECWPVLELVQALAPLPVHARRDETRSQRQENILGWAKTCDLLILDDLGAEEATGYVAERWRAQLLDILTARDGVRRCRTVVTINGGTTADQPGDDARARVRSEATGMIAARYSARVSTRLQRGCVGIWVEGEPLRKVATWDPFQIPEEVP